MGWCISATWSSSAAAWGCVPVSATAADARIATRARLVKRHIKTGWVLLLAGLLACAPVSSAAASGARRARAVAAYERAVNLRTALESKPEKEREKADYQKVINLFQSVYHASPQYTKTPLALAAVAELYEEMGRRFSEAKYFHESIKAYQFLQAEYPQHRLSRAASGSSRSAR